MLKALRKNTKIIIWTVVGSFVLWGGFSVGTQFSGPSGGGRIAGKLFGKDVPFQEFNIFYRANQIFSVSQTPITDPEILKIQTWQSIMLSKEAKQQGVEISDQEVRDEILRILRDSGIENPTGDFYKKWVRGALRQSPQDFEQQVREILRIQKLVRQINEGPLADPTEEELRDRFDREKNSLSLEFKRFSTKEEAEAFHQETPDAKTWTGKREENSEGFKTTGKIALDAIINLWGIPKEDALKLVKMDVNSVSEPTPIRDDFGVFLIIDKEEAVQEDFNDEAKEKYRERMVERKRRERFFEFSAELKERAALEDFIPSAEPLEEEPEAPAPSSESPTPETTEAEEELPPGENEETPPETPETP